jgi:hypothetical protein
MHKNIRYALLALGVAVIVTPAAVSEGHERQEHAKKHGPPASVVEKKAAHGAKKVSYVFKGTYSADGVKVLKGNNHVRRADLVGETVAFDFSAAKVRVDDVNADGKRDLADVQEGDKVVVQARLARRDPGAAPFAARKLVDQTHKKADGPDAETPESHDA